LAKVGIITLLHKGNGGSNDELESELLVALERTGLTKAWRINKVTVLDSEEAPSDLFSNRFSDFRGR
jgi:hypothetical protein